MRTLRAKYWSLIGLFVVMVGAGCSESTSSLDALIYVNISPRTVRLDPAVQNTQQLTATVVDGTGQVRPNPEIAWTSSNPEVARVSLTGVVTAVEPGTAQISATSLGFTSTASVVVEESDVAAVSLTPGSGQLMVGQSLQITARALDDQNNVLGGRAVAFSTTNPAVANVSSAGLVSAIGAGSATIIAVSEGQAAVAVINVTDPAPVVVSVTIDPPSANIYTQQMQQMSAVARDANGAAIPGHTFTWTSSNMQVASVSPGAVVTGQSPGTATIRASTNGVEGVAQVSVANAPVATVSISPVSHTLEIAQTVQFTASLRDAAAHVLTGRVVTWTSSNPAIASVASNGQVTGVSAGATIITATSEGQSASAAVVVNAPASSVDTVIVTPESADLQVAQSTQLTAIARDASGNTVSGRTYTWTSSDPTVATVSSTGLVTAVSEGTATVSASTGGRRRGANVRVSAPVISVTMTPVSGQINVAQTLQLSASARDANNNVLIGRSVTWSTSNSSVATVSNSGVVTGRAAGSATITANIEGQVATAAITVLTAPPVVTTVAVTPTSANVQVLQSTQLTATVRDANGNLMTGQSVTWTSSNAAVATVSSTGTVVGLAQGTATITATAADRSGTATITVAAAAPPPPAPVASVTVSPATGTVAIGETGPLTATLRDASNNILTGRTVTWSSSNNGVATVSANGTVTGVSGGNATITATSEGRSGTAAITVLGATQPPAVATVTVTPTTASIAAGAQSQLSATARDANGNVVTGQTFTWTSSNTAVATVSSSGLVSGVTTGSATITVAASGRTATAAITVTGTAPPPPPPGPRTVVWTSEWNSGLGTSTAARTDGNRWDVIGDPGVGLAVIPSGTLGFPTSNVLEVTVRESAQGFARLAKTGLPVPADGQSVFYRWYYRNEIGSTGDNSTHPIESGSNGGLDWCFNVQVQSNTTWRPEFRPGGNQSDVNRARFTGPLLQRGATYRFEVQIEKLNATSFRVHIRVYDAAGQLIADDDDFSNWAGGLVPTQRMTLADLPTVNFATNGGINLQEIRAGNNGLATSGYGSAVFAYQAAFAVCTGGWCGAYTPGEGQ